MAYATIEQFKARYGQNTGFSDDVITRQLLETSEQIDYFTQDRITRKDNGLADYSNFIQDRVQNAAVKGAYHALLAAGLSDNSNGSDGIPVGVTSFELGDLKIAKKVLDKVSLDLMSGDQRIVDLGEASYKELQRTGLMFAGLGTRTVIDLADRVDEGV